MRYVEHRDPCPGDQTLLPNCQTCMVMSVDREARHVEVMWQDGARQTMTWAYYWEMTKRPAPQETGIDSAIASNQSSDSSFPLTREALTRGFRYPPAPQEEGEER